MNWQGVKVLVTGAGGFIGSHLVEALVLAGGDVRAMLHYNSRTDWANLELLPINIRERITIVKGDLVDATSVDSAVQDQAYVFHLGAIISVPHSFAAPASYIDTNIKGTLNILAAAHKYHVLRLVHLSSSEVYGNTTALAIDELHPLQAQSPYAASKIAADKLIESYVHGFALPAITIRPFNNYGPRQSLRAIVPTIISQVLNGSVIQLGTLATVRDLLYVRDTVEGLMLAAAQDAAIGKVINLGNGSAISIEDLALTIGELVGKEITIRVDTERIRQGTSEVWRLCANVERAKELLNWQAKIDLHTGLKLTIEWMQAKNISAGYMRYNY